MKRVLSFFMLIAVLVLPDWALSQEQDTKGVELDLSADLFSRYVWRGTQYGGDFPSIQPALTLTWQNFSLGTWGAYSLTGEPTAQEFDFFLSFSFLEEKWSVTLTDYFFPSQTFGYDYFEYHANSTGHILEGSLSFNGTDKIPFTFLAALNFYGADAAAINDDLNSADFNTKSGILYSNYFELGYANTLKEIDYHLFAGFTLNNPKEAKVGNGYIGETGFYGEKAGLVNLGLTLSKKLSLSNSYSLPVSGSVIVNPMSKQVFYVFGVSI
jgi:hypothetical protein